MLVSTPSSGSRLRQRVDEVARFGTVGGAGYVVDVVVFNLLLYEGAGWPGPLHDRPIQAKVLSVCVATIVTFLGHRHWTWRRGTRAGLAREYAVFVMLNVIGMLIAVLCLAISHYLLGFTSALADNVSANVIGLALGTAFRFWSYRRFIFLRRTEVRSWLPR